MRGVSEVIAIILILMITISLAGLAYMFMSTTMADVTSTAGSTVDTTTSSMLTSFRIESIDIAKVYVRNTGQNALTSLSVYVNNEPAIFNVTTPIAAGAVGTITIYSFIPDGATIKVTSPSGFSTSKVANPCDKAVGCWKFDEGSGTVAYDSSPYGNDGTLINAVWTSGKYGSGVAFDGSNDVVFVPDSNSIDVDVSTGFTVSVLVKPTSYVCTALLRKDGEFELFICADSGGPSTIRIWEPGVVDRRGSIPIQDGKWTSIVATNNRTTTKLYVDGVLDSTWADSGSPSVTSNPLGIGAYPTAAYSMYGALDEVRIYNRAIY